MFNIETVVIITEQVGVMVALMFLGYTLLKTKMIESKSTKSMSNLLLYMVIPCVLIRAYQTDYDIRIVKNLVLAFFLSVFAHIIFIIIVSLCYAHCANDYLKKISKFSSVYSNCGSIAIPLLAASFGRNGVLIGSTYLAAFNLIAWSYGFYCIGEDSSILSLKSFFKNPGIMGTIVALMLFFFKIHLVGIVKITVNYLADMNAPLASILLGAYLGQSDIKNGIKNKSIYIVALLKLIAMPIVMILFFKLFHIEKTIGIELTISAACPVATVAALFAETFNMDTGYPSQVVSISTILSVVTLPIITWIAWAIL